MSLTVEVRFKGTRKAYFLWPGEEPLRVGEAVVVEAERGRDLGHVTAVGEDPATVRETVTAAFATYRR